MLLLKDEPEGVPEAGTGIGSWGGSRLETALKDSVCPAKLGARLGA